MERIIMILAGYHHAIITLNPAIRATAKPPNISVTTFWASRRQALKETFRIPQVKRGQLRNIEIVSYVLSSIL